MKKSLPFLLLFLLTIGAVYWFYSSKVIQIEIADGNKITKAQVLTSSVEKIMNRLDVTYSSVDIIYPALTEKITTDTRITINRAREIQIDLDGELKKVITARQTPSEILRESGIPVSKDTHIEPSANEKLGSIKEIIVRNYKTQEDVTQLKISNAIVYKNSQNMLSGQYKTQNSGSEGTVSVSMKVESRSVDNTKTTGLVETVTKEPSDKVILTALNRYLVFDNGDYYAYKRSYTMNASAYDAGFESTGKNPGDPGYGRTAIGTSARPGVVAVDPRVIPLGSSLYVVTNDRSRDYGFAKAEDKGSAIVSKKIDLYMVSRSAALSFGRRAVTVYVLEDKVKESMMNKTGGNIAK